MPTFVNTDPQRRKMMKAVRTHDTAPELQLRLALRERGLTGYRCAPKTILGKPDIAFTRWKVAIFVDGCFWHGCPQCYVRPVNNREAWDEKLEGNRSRDTRVTETLSEAGWVVLRFWEHEVRRELDAVADAVEAVLVKSGRIP